MQKKLWIEYNDSDDKAINLINLWTDTDVDLKVVAFKYAPLFKYKLWKLKDNLLLMIDPFWNQIYLLKPYFFYPYILFINETYTHPRIFPHRYGIRHEHRT